MLANRAQWTPELIAKANASRAEKADAWCPAEYRALNEAMRAERVPLPQRKQHVATEMLREASRRDAAKAAEAERLAALTPFERQMVKVAAGAKLIKKPVFRQADPAFTLGGVAPGML